MTERMKLLFLCTGNSCRSQMAQGWAEHLKADLLEAHSAGVEVHGINQQAVRVMAEVGVDISANRSKLIDEYELKSFDYIVTVCDQAAESCPVVPPGCRVVHRGFDDPPRLARDLGSEEEVLSCYRKVRDEIRRFVESLPQSLFATEEGK